RHDRTHRIREGRHVSTEVIAWRHKALDLDLLRGDDANPERRSGVADQRSIVASTVARDGDERVARSVARTVRIARNNDGRLELTRTAGRRLRRIERTALARFARASD